MSAPFRQLKHDHLKNLEQISFALDSGHYSSTDQMLRQLVKLFLVSAADIERRQT